MYTLAMAKNDYKEGWINGFSIVKTNIKKGHYGTVTVEYTGWVIEVWKDSPEEIRRQISAARGDVRIFKTLDAAVSVVEEIGWEVDYLTA